jgi:hypothetical protein
VLDAGGRQANGRPVPSHAVVESPLEITIVFAAEGESFLEDCWWMPLGKLAERFDRQTLTSCATPKGVQHAHPYN